MGLFLFLLSLLIAVVIALVMTNRVTAPAVPVCDRCLRERATRLRAMGVLLVATVGFTILATAQAASAASALLLVLGLGVAPLGALVAGSTARWAHLMRATVDRTGTVVVVKAAAPFAAEFLRLITPAPLPYPAAMHPMPRFDPPRP